MSNFRGSSPLSEAMSDTLERSRGEKAQLTKTPSHSQMFLHKTNTSIIKNYSDKNGNDVTKSMQKGRKTFAFWTLVCLLFVLAVGNLILTFTILAVLRLGHGNYYIKLIKMFHHSLCLSYLCILQFVSWRFYFNLLFTSGPLAVSSAYTNTKITFEV